MAAEELGDESLCIYDTVNATMFNDEERTSTTRKHILSLKPFAKTAAETSRFPPLSGKSIPYVRRVMREHLDVHFEGWTYSSEQWWRWILRLIRIHSKTWQQACIYDTLKNSFFSTPHNQDIVVELVRYWCPSTNTFVFPWGEATITLEDVWILGGFSVLGDPASLPLPSESVQTLEKMIEFQSKMSQKDTWKTEQVKWMDFFGEEETEHELEDVALLSIWLSRFVFPYKDPERAINRDVFSIAIHLSRGKRLALAPAVLAGVYHFLSLLKEKAFLPMVDKSLEDCQEIIPGPFQLVHHWALERCPDIAPGPACVPKGGPRIAKWNGKDLWVDAKTIKRELKMGAYMFRWRPYVLPFCGWVSHYTNEVRVVINGSGSDKELSFGLCLCACELEGVAGVPNQNYMPHRVTMQFGMDQHLPGNFAAMKPKTIDKFSFFVPTIWYRPAQSVEYLYWWQKSKEIYGKIHALIWSCNNI